VNSANQAITTPPGWALLADQATTNPSQFRFTIWWKPAGIGETSVALDIHTNASGASASIVRYSRPNANPSTPTVAALAVRQGNSGAQPTVSPAPDIVTDRPNATIISVVAIREGNALSLAIPGGFQLQTATTQASGQPTALAVASQMVPSAGGQATSPTWTQTGSPAQWAWATIAFA